SHTPAPRSEGPFPVLISGADAQGTRAQARQLADFLQHRPDIDVGRLAGLLARTRAGLPDRAVVVAQDRTEMLAGLDAVAEGSASSRADVQGRVAFVFPGQGTHWTG
ncbi:modular polyketide synthase, partial [Streptomyces sp. 8P21H-1]|nr:modular polyketide synthase [Streptomyces sp. 8P21H-1]